MNKSMLPHVLRKTGATHFIIGMVMAFLSFWLTTLLLRAVFALPLFDSWTNAMTIVVYGTQLAVLAATIMAGLFMYKKVGSARPLPLAALTMGIYTVLYMIMPWLPFMAFNYYSPWGGSLFYASVGGLAALLATLVMKMFSSDKAVYIVSGVLLIAVYLIPHIFGWLLFHSY